MDPNIQTGLMIYLRHLLALYGFDSFLQTRNFNLFYFFGHMLDQLRLEGLFRFLAFVRINFKTSRLFGL